MSIKKIWEKLGPGLITGSSDDDPSAAILYGLTAPILIAVILHICNNKLVMGEFTNSRKSNILGIITFLVMTIAAALLLYFIFIAS